jgi:hypothetical protein
MSATKTTITIQDGLRAAFSALLRGDTAERDRICNQLEQTFASKDSLPADTPLARPAKTTVLDDVHYSDITQAEGISPEPSAEATE